MTILKKTIKYVEDPNIGITTYIMQTIKTQ